MNFTLLQDINWHKHSPARFEVKHSVFYAFLIPDKDLKLMLEHLKKEHSKAVHFVWASRSINKYHQIVENQSDDGEPKGSSGNPSLNVLRGAGLVNTAVIIVRYFGGIKLGVGGLVRAYSSAVNLAISQARLNNEISVFISKSLCTFFVPYALMSRFEYFFNNENLYVSFKDFNDNGAKWFVEFSESEFIEFCKFSKLFENSDFKYLSIPLFAKNIDFDFV